MRATQLKSGTRIGIVTRIPAAIHTSSGWPAVARHDIVRMNIQGRCRDTHPGLEKNKALPVDRIYSSASSAKLASQCSPI
jgi:hypothetical protein